MPKYPLEDLARVREEQAAQGARELAEAQRARGASEEARRQAESRLAGHRRGKVAMMDRERRSLEGGELRGADLAQGAAWRSAADEEGRRLEQEVERARAAEAQAALAEDRARARAADGRARAEVLVTHRERWAASERAATERRDEDASLEAWRPRR